MDLSWLKTKLTQLFSLGILHGESNNAANEDNSETDAVFRAKAEIEKEIIARVKEATLNVSQTKRRK